MREPKPEVQVDADSRVAAERAPGGGRCHQPLPGGRGVAQEILGHRLEMELREAGSPPGVFMGTRSSSLICSAPSPRPR